MHFREFIRKIYRNYTTSRTSRTSKQLSEVKGKISSVLTNASLNYKAAEVKHSVRDLVLMFDFLTFSGKNKRTKNETFHVYLPKL